MTIVFDVEKETKNTIRFTEALSGSLDVPKVGTIYVPKATLKEIGYEMGKQLNMELSTR